MEFGAVPARLPNLNGLRAFEAAARLGSFTRAAVELSVTQTAVSHLIRRLEAELGHKLFLRGRGGLRLSPQGEQFLPAVHRAFEALREATAKLTGGEDEQVLTVSTLASFATKWLVPHLSGFQRLHPQIDVRISTSTELVDFERDSIDCAIRYGAGHWPGTKAARLMDEDIFPVCSPRLLAEGPPLDQPADLARHTLLHVTSYMEDWRLWLTAAGLEELDATRGPVFDIAMLAVAAAVEGLGVALGRTALVEGDLAAGRLVAPFDTVTTSDMAYHLVAPPLRWERPKIRLFRDWLLSEASLKPLLCAGDA